MAPPLLLGCIADDFAGATALAGRLVRAGMRVLLTVGVTDDPVDDADAVVVALRTRTAPAPQAVAQSLRALDRLRALGCRQCYFKIGSTFDSTPAGNIGPVAEALMDALGTTLCCVTPALPEHGRTVYKGYLFVGDRPLDESAMREHPLTPMTDANLLRVLQAQCRGKVGLVEHQVVRGGAAPIHARIRQLQDAGCRFAVVDALCHEDLMDLGRAVAGMPLAVGSSGLATGLPQNHDIRPSFAAAELPPAAGARAIVSGSCSEATRRQVNDFIERGLPALGIAPLDIAAGRDVVGQALAWATPLLGRQPVLVHSCTPPEAVRELQRRLGAGEAGALVERALAAIARGLVERGVGQLVVAGGETAGAAVQALDVRQLRIGPQIVPGVPWCHARSGACGHGLHLALKPGSSGTTDFFGKAFPP